MRRDEATRVDGANLRTGRVKGDKARTTITGFMLKPPMFTRTTSPFCKSVPSFPAGGVMLLKCEVCQEDQFAKSRNWGVLDGTLR